jgi:F-type H+-transporting ATPase subunit b
MEFLNDPEFWVAVAFVIAIGIIWWKGSGVITHTLDTRAAKIKAELEEAERLRKEAEAALALYQRRQKEALTEAAAIVERAKADAERAAEQAARDLETSLKRREELAAERIRQAETKAIAEVRAVAVDVAIAAARSLIKERLDPAHGAKLIDQAIQELPRQLH